VLLSWIGTVVVNLVLYSIIVAGLAIRLTEPVRTVLVRTIEGCFSASSFHALGFRVSRIVFVKRTYGTLRYLLYGIASSFHALGFRVSRIVFVKRTYGTLRYLIYGIVLYGT
jgi:hypothetical protein